MVKISHRRVPIFSLQGFVFFYSSVCKLWTKCYMFTTVYLVYFNRRQETDIRQKDYFLNYELINFLNLRKTLQTISTVSIYTYIFNLSPQNLSVIYWLILNQVIWTLFWWKIKHVFRCFPLTCLSRTRSLTFWFCHPTIFESVTKFQEKYRLTTCWGVWT